MVFEGGRSATKGGGEVAYLFAAKGVVPVVGLVLLMVFMISSSKPKKKKKLNPLSI